MNEDQDPRIVVLDDDPTGTQTVAGLPIVLTPDVQTLSTAARQWAGPLWVLTNTRAMTWAEAQSYLAATVDRVHAVLGPSVRLVLRGDSTLRGHVLGEIDTLSVPGSVALFVPAFVEQGRVTIGGVHYVTLGNRRVEVATTEYARDPEFSYRTSDLVQWIAERDPGRPAFGMPLKSLRDAGSSALADLLVTVPAQSVVVPDAETVAETRGWRHKGAGDRLSSAARPAWPASSPACRQSPSTLPQCRARSWSSAPPTPRALPSSWPLWKGWKGWKGSKASQAIKSTCRKYCRCSQMPLTTATIWPVKLPTRCRLDG